VVVVVAVKDLVGLADQELLLLDISTLVFQQLHNHLHKLQTMVGDVLQELHKLKYYVLEVEAEAEAKLAVVEEEEVWSTHHLIQ
jgi:hypothetical protein